MPHPQDYRPKHGEYGSRTRPSSLQDSHAANNIYSPKSGRLDSNQRFLAPKASRLAATVLPDKMAPGAGVEPAHGSLNRRVPFLLATLERWLEGDSNPNPDEAL